jgi:hypothetical protein
MFVYSQQHCVFSQIIFKDPFWFQWRRISWLISEDLVCLYLVPSTWQVFEMLQDLPPPHPTNHKTTISIAKSTRSIVLHGLEHGETCFFPNPELSPRLGRAALQGLGRSLDA